MSYLFFRSRKNIFKRKKSDCVLAIGQTVEILSTFSRLGKLKKKISLKTKMFQPVIDRFEILVAALSQKMDRILAILEEREIRQGMRNL